LLKRGLGSSTDESVFVLLVDMVEESGAFRADDRGVAGRLRVVRGLTDRLAGAVVAEVALAAAFFVEVAAVAFAGACLVAVDVFAGFFDAAEVLDVLAGVFLAGVFLAGVFLAGVFLASVFLAGVFVTAACATPAGFLAADFLGVVRFVDVCLAADFFGAACLAAGFFLATATSVVPPGECERRTLASISMFREGYPGRSSR
jgi:hypothetical protein